MVPQEVTSARDGGMSLSAWQVPQEGRHSPGTGGKYLSQKPLRFLLIQSPGQNHARERLPGAFWEPAVPSASRYPRVAPRRGSSAI